MRVVFQVRPEATYPGGAVDCVELGTCVGVSEGRGVFVSVGVVGVSVGTWY